jgi:hypothetical protein
MQSSLPNFYYKKINEAAIHICVNIKRKWLYSMQEIKQVGPKLIAEMNRNQQILYLHNKFKKQHK